MINLLQSRQTSGTLSGRPEEEQELGCLSFLAREILIISWEILSPAVQKSEWLRLGISYLKGHCQVFIVRGTCIHKGYDH